MKRLLIIGVALLSLNTAIQANGFTPVIRALAANRALVLSNILKHYAHPLNALESLSAKFKIGTKQDLHWLRNKNIDFLTNLYFVASEIELIRFCQLKGYPITLHTAISQRLLCKAFEKIDITKEHISYLDIYEFHKKVVLELLGGRSPESLARIQKITHNPQLDFSLYEKIIALRMLEEEIIVQNSKELGKLFAIGTVSIWLADSMNLFY